MEERKRTILAVVVALIVVVALLYSFGLNLFSSRPELELADPDIVDSQEPGGTAPDDAGGIPVEVTPATVQSVVASLTRFESYSRSAVVTYVWGEDSVSEVIAQVWTDSGWVRTETLLNSGVTECSIVGDGRLWLWYDDGHAAPALQVYEGPAEEMTADLMQHLPTYETVLALDPSAITAAGYEEREGHPCIYVEAEQPELKCTYRYWVSVNNGLLMAAETEQEDKLVYAMRSNEVISPLAGKQNAFTLPDGTVLYEIP